MRILALFDDGSQSVKSALNGLHDVVSVGISNKPTVWQCDLSDLNNINKIIALHNQEPFDLLIASPPCHSWSYATASKDGNAYRFSSNLKLKNFEEWKQNTYNNVKNLVEKGDVHRMANSYQRYLSDGVNGEKTALFTALLIQQLNIPFVIENPNSSMIWQYFKNLGLRFVKNKATYCSYDPSFSLKPTVFASNRPLSLLQHRKASTTMKNGKGRGDGSVRASIPYALIVAIVNQFNPPKP